MAFSALQSKRSTPNVYGAGRATGYFLRHGCCLLLLLIFSGLSGSQASAATAPAPDNSPAIFPGAAPSFAIADLDGDKRPDLAAVRAWQVGPAFTDYSIQVRLSAAGRQAIRLVAPSGGLSIEARDVDGDHDLDLVISTVWFGQPVAIFLNDGHGSFSRVKPGAFPNAFTADPSRWNSAFNRLDDLAAVPAQSYSGIYCGPGGVPAALGQSASGLPFSASALFHSILISHSGRAPPSQVYRL